MNEMKEKEARRVIAKMESLNRAMYTMDSVIGNLTLVDDALMDRALALREEMRSRVQSLTDDARAPGIMEYVSMVNNAEKEACYPSGRDRLTKAVLG